MTTPSTTQEAAGRAAEAVRALNHQTRPGPTQDGTGLDVVDVYDVLAELALMSARLPQLLRQLEDLLDRLVEDGQVVIVDGPNAGDPVAAGAVAGHWLAAAATAAAELAHRVDSAQQTLTWASPATH